MTEQESRKEVEKSELESEYRECCEDWRWRDKYVLDKLGAAGILFMLLGVALGTIPPENYIIKLCLLAIGGLFTFILSISVVKDTYYRDGTGKLLRRLSKQLSIDSSLQTLESLEGFDDGLNFQELEFPRKIKIQPDKSSLMIPKQLRDWLLKRGTFRWIFWFYLIALIIFVFLFTLVLVNKIWGLNLGV